MTIPLSPPDVDLDIDGTVEESASNPPFPPGSLLHQAVTAFLLFGSLAGIVLAGLALFGRGVSALDLVLAVVFYAIAGHGSPLDT